MSGDIQQARAVLAKWRSEATEGTWEHHEDGIALVNDFVRSGDTTIAEDLFTPDARLIVATAGNPDLLDAIDELLASAGSRWSDRYMSGVQAGIDGYASILAAAIVAADERMSA
jgi:hypothetical protein